MPSSRRRSGMGHFVVVACLVTITCGRLARRADAATSLYEQLKAAQEARDKAVKALEDVQLPPALEAKIWDLAGKRLLEDPKTDIKTLLDAVQSELTVAERLQVTSWFAARTARNAADAAVAKIERDYNQAFTKKDEALGKAEQQFEADQKHVDEVKSAIRDIPRDDAYLDRVSKLLERLKKSYEKMKADLGPYKDDFADVRNFLADKDERLKKIAALEAEIARRRGKGGGAVTTANDPNRPGPDGNPVPPPPGPLGDTYTLAGGPTLVDAHDKPLNLPVGTIKKADETGIEIEVTENDKTSRARLNIVKGLPASVRVNERVDLQITAEGEAPAFVTGQWYIDNVWGGRIPGGDSSASNLPGWRATNPTVGNFSFYFGAKEPVVVKLNAGRYDRENVWIAWRYQKSN